MLYVMSDIHGHLQRFESIMEQIKLGEGDHLFVLGDVIDIHPDGIQILQKLFRIYSSQDIRLYSDELISVRSSEDNETYWFSKRGLPWASRENSSFLRHRNCDLEQYSALTSSQAMALIDGWKSSCGTSK